MKTLPLIGFLFAVACCRAQPVISRVWIADNGNGTYRNPVLHADYSDPDAIRVGDDYYMVSSSFNQVPGLPLLHSKDLVNWELAGYALSRLVPEEHFRSVQHGGGVWAPSIRYHQNEFYIYYPDPDFGIYLIKSKSITGPWSEPLLVQEGKGLIDPCPLWDDNGKVYLVHAFAGSRAGIKSIIVVKELNKEGTKVTGEPVLVYDGHDSDPTIEGPKFYKRNGYYYIFAPAGGVSTGWQLALRSKNIYGPYERKVVMDQGSSAVNGPHQGAWMDTKTGENWFLHFQDKEAYGRVVHLQPLKWVNDWPVIGEDKDGDGKGEPVTVYRKPNTGKASPKLSPPESDEFNNHSYGRQWQWQANPELNWAFLTANSLRLYAVPVTDKTENLWNVPNLLLQKFPASSFTATAKISFRPKLEGDRTGLIVFGMDYAGIMLVHKTGGIYIQVRTCKNADKGNPEIITEAGMNRSGIAWLRVTVDSNAVCRFSYSLDGINFSGLGEPFPAKPGKWVGAKMGLLCTRRGTTNDAGYADIDWFRVEPLKP